MVVVMVSLVKCETVVIAVTMVVKCGDGAQFSKVVMVGLVLEVMYIVVIGMVSLSI